MKRPAEKVNTDRYLITYADLMNLLLILFIVLYSLAPKDVVKISAALNAISDSIGGKTTSSAKSSGTGSGSSAAGTGKSSGTTSSGTSDYSDFYADLIGLINKNGIKDKVDVIDTNDEVIITLKDNVLFSPGKADLNPEAVSLMTNIGGLLKKISYGQLIIEGHTDSDPIHTAQFQDNVELSLMRAYNVSKIFTDCGLNSKKILPVGYGENYPVAANNTAANKSKNRRVVITILRRGLTPANETISSDDIVNKMDEINKEAASSKTSSATTSSKAASSSKAATSSK